jgi:sulfate permease, SulP family
LRFWGIMRHLILGLDDAAVQQTEKFAGEEFTPKLVSALREGYDFNGFRRDAIAGLTVAIVALPLSMAIAIASHASPEKGLYTAIVGGFIISAFGGSRFQVGGPAGAFIVLLASIIDRFGYDGLLLVTLMAGIILLGIGLLRLGTYIKYVPHPVTIGFTAGIAVIIFVSQVKELLGLKLPGAEPAALVPKLQALWQSLPSFNGSAAILAGLSVGIILMLRKYKPHWPAFLIAVVATSVLAFALKLDVETILTRFGGIPRSLPVPSLPSVSYEKIVMLLPSALAVALLGGIESLLSAVVADSMSGRRHRSNMELVAQGLANIASSVFGGLPATGTIARTATNVRAGAHGPIAGILHAAFILLFMLVAAPLAGYIPLSALAAILIVVAWNMAEKAEFKLLLVNSKADAVVLLATFLLVIFVDLPTGIVVGVVLGCLMFMHRMAEAIAVETRHHADQSPDAEYKTEPGIIIHRISGAFFFGAASTVSATLERINEVPKAFILDFAQVPFVDSSAAHALQGFLKKAAKQGAPVYLTAASLHVRRELIANGIKKPDVHYGQSIDVCIAAIKQGLEIDQEPE